MENWTDRGSLTVISGFSGAGKGTIMKELLKAHPEYVLSVSVTTREPREGEEEGKSYFFISKEEFARMVREDELLEHADYASCSYGTPRAFVEKKIAEGADVILEIESQGAAIIKAKCPSAIMIFVMTPSAQMLKDRLIGRGTETMDKVRERLLQAQTECDRIDQYDTVIINEAGKSEEAAERVHEAIQAQKRAPGRIRDFVEKFGEDLREINVSQETF